MPETQYLTTPAGMRLAYVDSGGPGRPVLALHGAYGRSRTFLRLADDLAPDWRIIAVDQRCHGRSDRSDDVSREAFVADAAAVVEQLELAPAVVLGHSLGGISAFQLATRRPELVAAAIVVDVGAEIDVPDDHWLDDFPDRFPDLQSMRAALESVVEAPEHFLESAVEDDRGWFFRWRAADVRDLKREVCGTWWSDWAGSSQPVLLLRGADSPVIGPELAERMVRVRANTELVSIGGAGHDLHLTHCAEFAAAVGEFLARIGSEVQDHVVGAS
ncbi:Pimeloyl-ACP methyl ester carboxylesterase [Saccharopolyspora kobensis]|uniref:Pimeloyl-ACP methyl ester carboxylesterase n=1 Tax=Saccharopolyspora kobensis TaxID=146035 RepID=A0A1H5WXL8_9PSEU|nr:alpha/beta hydrolase [Saccharopolyspora kobensis]SEG04234.1 Pimeloyl-ACP methyl ester carboxylesterase [Saccharopolyspora kobensis]SFD80768.1 Pimeloyl-ACP methyl ester carboxylesterase [Saccharopolyspora kobensis]